MPLGPPALLQTPHTSTKGRIGIEKGLLLDPVTPLTGYNNNLFIAVQTYDRMRVLSVGITWTHPLLGGIGIVSPEG